MNRSPFFGVSTTFVVYFPSARQNVVPPGRERIAFWMLAPGWRWTPVHLVAPSAGAARNGTASSTEAAVVTPIPTEIDRRAGRAVGRGLPCVGRFVRACLNQDRIMVSPIFADMGASRHSGRFESLQL